MTYYCGVQGFKTERPSEPHLECNNCRTVMFIKMGRMGPPAWLMNRKAAPGWKMFRLDEKRIDYCPECRKKLAL